MRKGRNTGLINLLRVKTVVFTGILAGAMALSGCNGGGGTGGLSAARPGPAGSDGAAGKDASPAQAVVSVGRYCTEFTFGGIADGTETGKNKRKVVVIAVDEKAVAIPDKQLADQYSDEDGCIAQLKVIKGYLNKVTVSKTTGGNESFAFLVNATEKAGGLAPVSGSEHVVSQIANDVTEYLFILAYSQVYNIQEISQATLREFYEAMSNCSDLRSDHEDGLLGAGTKLGAGLHSIVKCLQDNPSLMKKLATTPHLFKAHDGKFANRELDDSGTALTTNASFLGNAGTASFGDGNFTIAATSGTNCSLFRIMRGSAATNGSDANSSVTYQIAGETVGIGTPYSTCQRVDYDGKYDGIHATNAVGGSGITQHYGFVLLSRGEDSTGDAGTFEYIPAGIAYFGAEATNDDDDWNLTTGDFQDYNLSEAYGTRATMLMVSNQDKDSVDDAISGSIGMATAIDEHTTWMIFGAQTEATVFAASTTPYTYYDDALNNRTANASLFQECNPSEAVRFAANDGNNYRPLNGLRVRQQITDGYQLSVEDAAKYRVIVGQMLMVFLSPTLDPDAMGAVAEAAMDRIEADPVLSKLVDRRDVLDSNGASNLPPVALLEAIARTGALCVPEVVDLGGGSLTKAGDDMLAVEWDSSGDIATIITYPGSSRPNYIISGAAPFSLVDSSCDANQDDKYTSLTGIATGFCASAEAKFVDVKVGSIVHKAAGSVALE